MGAADQAFLNGAILVESSLSPDLAMETLLQIEIKGGRKRIVKWGNRTIDLDIILVQHNDCPMLVDSELIKAPHPEAHKRDFVIVPLAEICPEWSIFPAEETISELATKKFSKHDMKKI